MADHWGVPVQLADLARAREALLERIVDVLQSDQRVCAAWLSGSFGRVDADACSDLDLHIVLEDGAFDTFLAERSALYTRVALPLLVQKETASDGLWPRSPSSTPGGAQPTELSGRLSSCIRHLSPCGV